MDSFVKKMVTSQIMNSERGKGLSEDTSILNLRQNALMGSEVAFIFKIYVSVFDRGNFTRSIEYEFVHQYHT